jgi:hypothetical protein
MVEDKPKPERKRTPADIQTTIDSDLFAGSPVSIIQRYLESFASDGSQTFPVPQHVLEALARRFRLFLRSEAPVKSIDAAFGGQVGRQRQRLAREELIDQIAFDVIAERKRLHSLAPSERGAGTPHEIACELVAQRRGMNVDTIRALYKESGPGE